MTTLAPDILERGYHVGYLAHLDRLGIPRPSVADQACKALEVAGRQSPGAAAAVAAEIQRRGITLPPDLHRGAGVLAGWAPAGQKVDR